MFSQHLDFQKATKESMHFFCPMWFEQKGMLIEAQHKNGPHKNLPDTNGPCKNVPRKNFHTTTCQQKKDPARKDRNEKIVILQFLDCCFVFSSFGLQLQQFFNFFLHVLWFGWIQAVFQRNKKQSAKLEVMLRALFTLKKQISFWDENLYQSEALVFLFWDPWTCQLRG